MSSYKELVDQINDLIIVEFLRSSPEDIHAKCIEISNKYKAVEDKISFEKYYLVKLHERLILTGEKCIEYEKEIVKEIRNFNEMFNPDFDKLLFCIEESKKISAAFCQQRKSSLEFHPFIIPKPWCPLFIDQELTCSPFSDLCDQFKAFYAGHKKEKPYVNNYYSFCNLKLTFPGQNKEYIVRSNFFSSTILLSLSEKQLKFSEIVDLLKCDKKYASLLITKLHKMKLINRNGSSQKLEDNDSFSLNTDFNSPDSFILIQPHSQNCADNHLSVAEIEKKESIKYAIFRFLKQSQKLERSVLEEKVKKVLENKFNVSPEMIELEIKKIEGQYARRTIEDGKEILTYIA